MTPEILTVVGEPLELKTQVGEGGEGRVYRHPTDPTLLVKLYKGEADEVAARAEKISSLLELADEEVGAAVAVPQQFVRDKSGTVVGHTMEYLQGWAPLYTLYQTKTRVKRVVGSDWSHLIRISRHLATCIAYIHKKGWVVGDLNESNVFVSSKALVKLIDIDSFQVGSHLCLVGKSELLAPELIGVSLEKVRREPSADLYSLAILIFQTLMLGRHPFAGRPVGNDLSLEEAMAKRIYPYRRGGHPLLALPPGVTPDWLPPGMQALFERAFEGSPLDRPRPEEWIQALRELESNLSTCATKPIHRYARTLLECPWCQAEKRWGVLLFEPEKQVEIVPFDAAPILAKIQQIPVPTTVELPPTIMWEEVKQPFTVPRVIALGLWYSFFVGAIFYLSFNRLASMNFIPMVFLWLGAMSLNPGLNPLKKKKLKQAVAEYFAAFEKWRAEADPELFVRRREQYEELLNWEKREKELRFDLELDAKRLAYGSQMERYLAKYSIHVADCPSRSEEAMRNLESRGIMTAYDLTPQALQAWQSSAGRWTRTGRLVDELLTWRKSLELHYWDTTPHMIPAQEAKRIERQLSQVRELTQATVPQAEQDLLTLAERLKAKQRLLGPALHEKRAELVKLLSNAQGIQKSGVVDLTKIK